MADITVVITEQVGEVVEILDSSAIVIETPATQGVPGPPGPAGSNTFVGLTDTPSTYSNGLYAQSTTSGIVWATVSGSGASTFIELTDTPSSYDNGKYARSTTNGVEWTDLPNFATEEELSTVSGILQSEIDLKVPTSRTINGIPLTDDITILTTGGLSSSYFFCDDVVISGTSPVWHELERQSDGGLAGSHSITSTSYTEFDRYITHPLNTDIIPEGNWVFIIYSKITNSYIGHIQATIYRVDNTGTIVGSSLGDGRTEDLITASTHSTTFSIYTTTQTGWDLTDRIGIVLEGKVNNVSATLTYYHDRSLGWASEVNTPLTLLHNQLNGLNNGDYKHLTASQLSSAEEIIALNIHTFTDLTDTPNIYDNGKFAQSTSSGIVWATVSGGTGASTFIELTDTPSSYDDGKFAQSTASGVVWADVPASGVSEAELITCSGVLNNKIDTVSGTLQTNINSKISDLVSDTTPQLGGDLDANTHAIVAADHGTAATAQVVNVCYGTGDPPDASTTTEGTLYIKYTA